jgi:uncharacterized protein YndB with AHSA1/START domain
VAFHGEYREIVPNERIVATEVYEGMPADEAPGAGPPVTIVSFTESGGRTTLTQLIQCHTKELRDLILESGTESGMQESMDALEEVAKSLR